MDSFDKRPFVRQTFALALLIAAVMRCVSAQEPSECPTYPDGSGIQTIVTRLEDSKCVIDKYFNSSSGIPSLHIQAGETAYWEVCNLCNAPVDVHLIGFEDTDLETLFMSFDPFIQASRESERRSIGTGARGVQFHGRAISGSSGSSINRHKYNIGVRLSGTLAYDDIDPEVQLDEGGLRYGRTTTLLATITAAIVALVIGFFLGRRSARTVNSSTQRGA